MGALLAAATQTKLDTPDVDWSTLSPLLVLLGGATLLLVVGALWLRKVVNITF